MFAFMVLYKDMQILNLIKKYKVWSGVLLIGLLVISYFVYSKINTNNNKTYTFTEAKIGDIVNKISGTGQVSSLGQIEIKAKASGDVSYINSSVGKSIKKGELIMKLDSRDAEISLKNAELALQKLIKPADDLSLTQSQNNLEKAKNSSAKYIDDLDKYYDESFNNLISVFLDLPNIKTSMDSLFYSSTGYLNDSRVSYFDEKARSYKNDASVAFDIAKNKYELVLLDYNKINRNSSKESIDKTVSEAYVMVGLFVNSLKNTKIAFDYIKNLSSNTSADTNTVEANITTWSDKVSAFRDTLSLNINNINNTKNNIANSLTDISEKEKSLVKLKTGADTLDIETEKLNLLQKQYAYQDYFIRAPFDGVIAKINFKNGESVGSGASVATIVTNEKVANILFNEVDIAKIETGQKVNVKFDAIQELEVEGEVREIDLVGTVNQGVVTYNVAIVFKSEDKMIKSGMSVSVDIITSEDNDLLVLPNQAIKKDKDQYYVEYFKDEKLNAQNKLETEILPEKKYIEVGIQSDTLTEVLDGLEEGDRVVLRSVGTAGVNTTPAPSLFSVPRNAGGANRLR